MTDKKPDNIDKFRVLISGHLPPPSGGMATYYQTLLDSSLSMRVEFCFVQTSSQKRELSSSGRATFSNLICAIKDCWRFTRAITTNCYRLAHVGTAAGLSFLKHSYCVWLAKILGSKVLLHPHCSLSVLYYERSKWWQWFFRRVIRWTNGIVVLSKEWLELSSIVPGCQIYYLPNAIDLKYFSRVGENHIERVNSKKPRQLLYLGYIGEAKGSFDLLEAAIDIHAHGTAMIFNLVGDELTPGELSLLQKKIKISKMEDIFLLHASAYNEDKLKFFQDADIFIYPSYHEGMPMAIIEAMACGLPIVATRVGGIPDLIEDGINGILVEPGQPEQLASAICKLDKDHELRASMGKASYQFACEHYDIERHVMELVSIYYKTLFTKRG